MSRLRFIGLLAALALIAAACGGSSSDATTTTAGSGRPATTTPSDSPTTSTPDGGDADEIARQIDELIVEAQQIRGLELLQPIDVVLLTDAEYQARFQEILEEDLDPDDIAAINALLRMLGIISPNDDYRQLLEVFVTTGTGGFYDSDTEELVVRLVGDELGPQARSVVVHEVVHALQDQHFTLLDDRENLEGDPAYVAIAIAEGDALLREATYVQSLSLREQAAYVAEFSEIDLSALDAIPGYIRNSLEAPYLDGFQFHQLIGIDSIDDQFTDPPESSEQLLSQTAYLRDEQPIEVTLPDLELPGYELWFDAPAGQKDLELMLGDALSAPDAQRAADGWGGDLNRVYNAGADEAVYVLKYVGDTKQDAEELEAAFLEFIDELVPAGTYTFVERTDADLLVMIASDPSVGPQLEAAFS
ncbi:MAG: hypothetical protein HKN74_12865 [Acidimicrobiia bacterium]|nr:hypothetical protein [Acidimicrobiia bacterium]NNF11165.1 hypothetical protein [Acidimicrobiia bacterium]NNL69331.1 hypothetical protein [Acidimicrobiia bacterium]